MHTAITRASLSEPHLVLLLDEMCVCLYHMSSVCAKPMYKCACVGWSKHMHKPDITGNLSIQYTYFNLQSLQWNDMSDHGPRLPRQGEGRRQTSEETLCQRRESVTQSGGHLNQWKRGNCTVAGEGKEMETNMRRVMHSRERAIYSRSNSV